MSSVIEARYHQAVVALAEELNYTRAADRVGISQPALTKQIMELEKTLGYLLFERDRKHVVLTQAGEVFAEEARLALMHSERAVHLGRAANHGREHIVAVGRTPFTDPDLVSSLFAIRLPLYPTLRIQLESAFVLDLVRSVATAALDAAIVTEVPETKGITQVPLASAPLHIGLRESHPAAKLDRVHLRDIGDANWAMFAKRVHPLVYDTLFRVVEQEQVKIKELHHFMSVNEAIALVTEQDCIAIVTASASRQLHHQGVVFRPLEHAAFRMHTSLIMRADNNVRLVNGFARAYLKHHQTKPVQKDLFGFGEGLGIAVG
jgi:DNA-binding transcriptional LysR family regulator